MGGDREVAAGSRGGSPRSEKEKATGSNPVESMGTVFQGNWDKGGDREVAAGSRGGSPRSEKEKVTGSNPVESINLYLSFFVIFRE
ncbi:MAG: hypothetical protein QHH04_03195 [Methanolinea sp.]|nr:hypothetical protein [Methanolinea sp.]